MTKRWIYLELRVIISIDIKAHNPIQVFIATCTNSYLMKAYSKWKRTQKADSTLINGFLISLITPSGSFPMISSSSLLCSSLIRCINRSLRGFRIRYVLYTSCTVLSFHPLRFYCSWWFDRTCFFMLLQKMCSLQCFIPYYK